VRVAPRPDEDHLPRFFFDIDDGERIRDTRGHELPDLNAARVLAQRAASELIAHDLRKTGAVRVRVDVWNENGECVLSALGHGAVLIAGAAEASQGIGPSDEAGALVPLDRATRHAIAVRRAIDEDGSASLRHLVNMLICEIGRTVARRLCAAEHKRRN
jgi:hypothetical protein